MSRTDGLVQVSVISSVLSMTIPRLAFYNTLRSSPSGRHFAEDNFECIFFKKEVWILIIVPLQFVPKGVIDKTPAHWLR